MTKKALVIGGGVAGIQAALDLGDMGVETYLVEKSPSVGGRMAQLDKTFPTNDCSMCILSPKLVEVGSHPYITILSNSEVVSLEGSPPDLKVKVVKHPRYVDEEKCNGCGVCTTKCPIKILDEYNKNLNKTKCIRITFPQAVPAIAIIDKDSCRYFKTGKCRVCEKFCQAKAIDFEQKEQIIDLEVGSVIVACGTQEYDARLKNEYGYKLFPNVITSIEYERILSASGPSEGHVLRPSDNKEPEKIAILQCVGSRDVQAGNEHCSSICCMQAAKDAIITREHLPQAQTTVFYMDIRAYGKGFDRFIDRAKDEHKTRFICGRVSEVNVNPVNENLLVTYMNRDGRLLVEEFELLILSVGLEPSASSKEVVKRLGGSLDTRGFCATQSFLPVNTSREGVFVCGSISGPKDIPESVMEASGAASAAATLLGDLPVKEIEVSYPREKDIRGKAPRVGVFVCRCGINIAATVDVPAVVEYVSRCKGVKHAQELLFACAQDSQKVIKKAIGEHDLNRVVVSACTPRTHEPLFQKTLKEAGINPYLFEFANIREQCSWVHQKEPDAATQKAKELVKNAVAKVIPAEPLYKKTLPVNNAVLVIGGGLAGMTAATDLASQGFTVHIVEKENQLGGNLRHVQSTLAGEETALFLEKLIREVTTHPNIKLYLNGRIKGIAGYIGNFKTTLASPEAEFEHGVVIIASGGSEYKPGEYLYGEDNRIVTLLDLEKMIATTDKGKLQSLKSVVMIQCTGSREDERPYCSRVCCSNAIKNAIKLKTINPETNVSILFRDIRTYGLKESYYRTARDKKIIFVRYEKEEKPRVHKNGKGLMVTIRDRILNKNLEFYPDLLVLSTGIVPNDDNKALSQLLKVPLDQDGYFLEAHVKLRPVDFATDGVFVCGLAHYPKDISETISQARAAAGRAATILSKDTIEAEGKVSFIRDERCAGCGACVEVCAYNAIELNPAKGIAEINEALCKGCGVCSASCRCSAIDIKGFRNEQILMALESF